MRDTSTGEELIAQLYGNVAGVILLCDNDYDLRYWLLIAQERQWNIEQLSAGEWKIFSPYGILFVESTAKAGSHAENVFMWPVASPGYSAV